MAAYSFVSAGSVVTSSSGAALSPVGSMVSSGNLLLLFTGQRGSSNYVSSLAPNFTQLGAENTNGSLEIWGRIASGTSADEPSVDWSGSTHCAAWIEQYSGDVYTDLASIVAHIGGATATQASLRAAGITVTTDNCLLVLLSRKNCTAADATTFTAPGSFTKRQQYILNGTHWLASASWQQTSATTFAVTNWTDDDTVNESLAANSLTLAIRTAIGGATRKLKVLAHSDAQSKTGVTGVVFAAPSGSDITGARIGEFTGGAFSGSLESGQAVLKVPVADFEGDALTLADTPRVHFRYDDSGTLKGCGIAEATVIYE